MTPEQKRARRRGRIVAWILLVVMGVATIGLNVVHYVTTGKLGGILAVVIALVPVIAYVGLSEIVAVFRGWVLQTVTITSMIMGMALSMSAVADVVRPEAGPYLCWLFGAVMDLPVVIALYVIMNEPADGRAAKPARARKPAHAAAPRTTAPARADAATAREPVPAAHGPVAPAVAHAEPGATGHGPAGATPGATHDDAAPNGDSADSGESVGSFAERAKEHEDGRERYRQSVLSGSPLSDRNLGKEFKRSRNWGGQRIKEVEAEQELAEASSS